MRILACSDLHGDLDATRRLLSDAGAADVIVVAGDLGNEGKGAEPVLSLLRSAARPVVLVAGNHDSLAVLRSYCADWPGGHLLHGTALRLQGQLFFGLGGEIPRSRDALWNLAVSETQASRMFAACPPGAVLITHTPPHGLCDRQKNGRHAGARVVRDVLMRTAPRLHLCGHVQAAFGQEERVGECTVRNLGPSANWFSL